jgi:predicted nucleotidyltransferase
MILAIGGGLAPSRCEGWARLAARRGRCCRLGRDALAPCPGRGYVLDPRRRYPTLCEYLQAVAPSISEMPDLTLIREFKRRAEAALPGRVVRVVLFGSRARGEMRPGSDWDVAVFVRGPATTRDTLDLADAAFDLILESGETIHPIALAEDGAGVSPLLLDTIDAEGMAL